VKLQASDLKDYPELLQKCKAISHNGKNAYPQHVYISEEDGRTLVVNIIKGARKEAPSLKGKALQAAIGYHRLNLEPNGSLNKAIKKGYALVDDERIEELECISKREDATNIET
jgi:hypothetical protein